MKNSFLMAAFIAIASCSVAPPPPPPPPAPPLRSAQAAPEEMTSATVTPTAEDRGVLMRNGTVMTTEDGNFVPLTHEVILRNGDRVLPSGEVIHADGSRTRMEEGMSIDQSGIMTDRDGNRVSTGK